jgi:ATP-dependent DNA helicase RecG
MSAPSDNAGEKVSLNADALRKIIELETKKGYSDSAVIGGLEAFLIRWSGQAAASFSSPNLLRQFKKLKLDKSAYASLSREKRRDLLEGLQAFLSGVESDTPDKTKSPTTAAKKVITPKKPKSVSVKPSPATAGGSLDASVTVVSGISDTLAKKFARLGVKTVRDLLYFFPHRHFDYSQRKTISQLSEGKEETIVANVWETRVTMPGGRRSTEAIVGDETGNIRVVWFNNQYIARSLKANSRVMLSGRVGLFHGQHVFQSPEWEVLEDKELIHTGRLVPQYHLTAGLGSRQTRRLMKSVIDNWAGQVVDFLPLSLRERQKLLQLPQAISQAHFPDDATLKDRARVRLAFDELLLLQLGVLAKKRQWQVGQPGHPFSIDRTVHAKFIESLPFVLTAAQNRVLKEILSDLERKQPMSRLLQGEVGSGKTVVAAAALLMAAANGFQGALMAPTEILAGQHFKTVYKLLSRAGACSTEEDSCLFTFTGILPRPMTVALLTGDMPSARKRELQKLIKDGSVDIAIGTHALIQKDVGFHKLGLAVIDEQHRFGVTQRSALRQQGFNPHMLVMTATPIPRTLALTLYGDLDLSVIDELPPGRQIVKTKWLKPEQRASAYAFIRKQVGGGRQAFIICPLVEESDAVQAKAAIAEFDQLSREVFPEYRLGLLHGRMKASEKDEVMRAFNCGELNILVATPVVEVGIDVPNATVMLVESADRFGLSQLHQFRGRVGRGKEQSYCMLLAENPSEVGQERLKVIEEVFDGFKLAEEDLKLRGPGEFFGTRQSGLPDLRMARLSDVAILELARTEATRLFEEDPRMKKPEHSLLVKELVRVWPDFEAGEWS